MVYNALYFTRSLNDSRIINFIRQVDASKLDSIQVPFLALVSHVSFYKKRIKELSHLTEL